METSLMMQAVQAIPTVRPFLSNTQLMVMAHAGAGEEGPFFQQKFIDLAQQIAAMPKTYEQEGKDDEATAYLHYFVGGCDWYITEKDASGGGHQAYGYAILNGDDEMAECGYISIEEITHCGAELDLHFTPCTLAEIKAKRAEKNVPEVEAFNLKPWVVVENVGTDEQYIWAEFEMYVSAVKECRNSGGRDNGFDVMKRLDDGTLTTEF